MSEVQSGTDLVLAHSGQLVDILDVQQVAAAYREVDTLKRKLEEADRTLREALAMHAREQGRKTMYVEGIGKIEVRGNKRTEYPDPLALAEALRAVGAPESTISEIVQETVSHKIDGRRAEQAGRANPEYAEVIERHKTIIERTPNISIS